MLHTKQGSVSRIVMGCFIVLAFCFALVWPQYNKRHNAAQLNKAAQLGRSLAFAEESYKQSKGQYTAQFNALDLSLPCPLISHEGQIELSCKNYTYRLEGGQIIKVEHKQLPVWLEINIPAGTVTCNYGQDDWAGQDLCARMQ